MINLFKLLFSIFYISTGEEKSVQLVKPTTNVTEDIKKDTSNISSSSSKSKTIVFVSPVIEEALERHPQLEEKVKESLVVVPVTHVTPVIQDYLSRHPSISEQVESRYVVNPLPIGISSSQRSAEFVRISDENAKQLWLTRNTIRTVENSPSDTRFRTGSGEEISRGQAIDLLKEQERNLVRKQTELRFYESHGYNLNQDEQGNIIFVKPGETLPVEKPYEPSLGGFASFYFSGFTPTFGLSGFTNPEENIKLLQQQMISTEQRRAKMLENGDYLGLGWEVITSPIPMTFVTAGLGFVTRALAETSFGSKVYGEVTLPRILGSKTISATPSRTVSNIIGGAFVGAGTGSIVHTFNEFGADAAKQSLLITAVMIPVYASAFRAGENVYANLKSVAQIRSPYFTRMGKTGVEAFGVQKYIDVFGKRVYIGEFKPLAFKTFPGWEAGPPSWSPDLGNLPSSIYDISPLGKPSVVPVEWMGKTFVETGISKSWQPIVPSSLIVKPISSIVPFKPIIVPEVIKWQPNTGLTVHPSEIKSLDELFKVYRSGKLSTEEFQSLRDVLKPVETTKPVHPLAKLPVDVSPKPWNPPHIKFDITKEGVISTSWYGKKRIETGLGWQSKFDSRLSTVVFPKPVVFRAYETYYRFLIFEPKQIIKPSPIKVIGTKPFKKGITIKDIVKTDKEITSEFGGGISTSRQGGTTVSVLEPPVVEKESVVINVPKEKGGLVVPEELKVPVSRYKTYSLQEVRTGPKNIFQETLQELFQSQVSKTGVNILFPIVGVKTGVKPEIILSTKKGVIQNVGTNVLTGVVQGQVRGVGQGRIVSNLSDVDKIFAKVFENPFEKSVSRETPENIIINPPETPKPIEEPPPPSKQKRFDLSDEIVKQGSIGNSFHVLVKSRQFVNGKRVSKGTPYRVTKNPLSYLDALAFGASQVNKNAKATFILEPSDNKPGKLSKSVPSWDSVIFQFDKKEGNRFIEKSRYRIDSPGEIREISMKGWISHKKNKRRRR